MLVFCQPHLELFMPSPVAVVSAKRLANNCRVEKEKRLGEGKSGMTYSSAAALCCWMSPGQL